MTDQRKAKRAIRARMAQTGQKYTDARRSMLAGEPPRLRPALGAAGGGARRAAHFTDQARNAILLAEDEARMLGRAHVSAEHLLLAVARRGNVESLLASQGVGASDIFALLLARDGIGTELVRGPLAQPLALLADALIAGTARGVHGASTQHLLLAISAQEGPAALLSELGIADAAALVDAAYPPLRGARELEIGEGDAEAALARPLPSPGPMPPVFERYSAEARAAVAAAEASARELESAYVDRLHLLAALLGARAGVLASVHERHAPEMALVAARAGALLSERRATQSTDIFTAPARALLAEDVLAIAARRGEPCLTSGHLLLALLETEADAELAEVLALLPAWGAIAAEVEATLPGAERMTL